MQADQLEYQNLKPLLAPFEEKGRGESIGFLNWFLENIFRLDAVEADDAICDRPNDRGIDGIYVDHTQECIFVLQSKLKQSKGTTGDAPLRELAGTITQLDSSDSVQSLLDGGGNLELKTVLVRNNIKGLVSKGYTVKGAFICNRILDANGQEFVDQTNNIQVFDPTRIASEFIDIETEGGVKGEFVFDASYVAPMALQTGDVATSYILPVQALELVNMEGIDDGTLFSQNVRLSLGNTKVNKALSESVSDQAEHQNFPLYHNGVTILCDKAELDDERLTITNYVVVNGAQSISTFKKTRASLSENLRVLAKVVQLNDASLSRKITVNSNNQNAIKPRDLKATNDVQLRLREEFKGVEGGKYELEIKRGQPQSDGTVLITNEEAGRLLLAFDLMEPETCHQVYKLFDDKYAEIFARPAVNAYRVIFLHLLMERVQAAAPEIEFKPLSKYGLTRFFLLSVLSELVRSDAFGKEVFQNPKLLFEQANMDAFLDAAQAILSAVIVDLNYEVKELGEQFDYKGDLKSPVKLRELRAKLLRSFEKDVARKKADSLAAMMG